MKIFEHCFYFYFKVVFKEPPKIKNKRKNNDQFILMARRDIGEKMNTSKRVCLITDFSCRYR